MIGATLSAAALALGLLAGSGDGAPAAAQTIYLKDGSVVRGSVQATTDESVTISTPNGVLTVPKTEVMRIDFGGEPLSQPVATPIPAATPAPVWEPPAALAAPPRPEGRWHGYANAFFGNRAMSDYWDPVQSQGQFAIETTFLPPDWGLGLAVDLTSSYAEGTVEDDPDLEGITFEGSTSEFDFGIRGVTEATRGICPITASVGTGICSMNASFAGRDEAGNRLEERGSGVGYWFSLGLHFRMFDHLNLGGSFRVSRADVELFGVSENAGGVQIGLTMGGSWGWPSYRKR